jgi:hypothetical protein
VLLVVGTQERDQVAKVRLELCVSHVSQCGTAYPGAL